VTYLNLSSSTQNYTYPKIEKIMATPQETAAVLAAVKQQQALIGNASGVGPDILKLAEKLLTNGSATAADGKAAGDLIKQATGFNPLEAGGAAGLVNLANQLSSGNAGAGIPSGSPSAPSAPNGFAGIPGFSGLQTILSKVVAPTKASGVIPGISIDNNLFKTDETTKGFGVKALSQKASNKVNEIGIFAVDDATGKIGTLLPGSTAYIKAALDSAKSIFSTLGGDFLNTANQEFAIDPSKNYQFFEIQDGSISDLRQQLVSGKTPENILFSLPDKDGKSAIQVTNSADGSGYNVAINDGELVLDVLKLSGVNVATAIGSGAQRAPEGRTIDLSAFVGQTLKADIVTKSSAGYTNNVGFYVVEDAIGTIKLIDGTFVKPGDANYAQEAVKNALTNSALQAGKTETSLDQSIVGGRIYAPVVVAQGTFNDPRFLQLYRCQLRQSRSLPSRRCQYLRCGRCLRRWRQRFQRSSCQHERQSSGCFSLAFSGSTHYLPRKELYGWRNI
jgi:hypothetical protein